jgi:predicted TIM-barrel fold metal-dependent hydrolase
MHVHGGVRSWGWEDDRRVIDAADRLGIDQMVCSISATGGRWVTPVVFPIIERTIEWGVPILCHAGRLVDPADIAQQPFCSHAADFVDVGRRYPEAMIIEAHIVGGGDWEWSLKVLRDAPPSIYLETSGSVLDAGAIERCVRDFGDERLLFGTDMTMEGGVAKILDAEITDEQRERIFWRNFQAVLDRRRA